MLVSPKGVSELLSEYIRVHNGRAFGLHGLMLHKNHIKGTDGDLFSPLAARKLSSWSTKPPVKTSAVCATYR